MKYDLLSISNMAEMTGFYRREWTPEGVSQMIRHLLRHFLHVIEFDPMLFIGVEDDYVTIYLDRTKRKGYWMAQLTLLKQLSEVYDLNNIYRIHEYFEPTIPQ